MTRWITAASIAIALGISGAAFAAAPSFEELDANKDGLLSKTETMEVDDIDFAKADANGDGMLTRSEYQAATS